MAEKTKVPVAAPAAPAKAVPKVAPKAAPAPAAAEEVTAIAPISRVRDYVKNKGFRVSPETIDSLNIKIANSLDAAMKRAEGNGRQTIKPCDM